jgi:photosystem II stability/assembly factor-like uncharacterized protein
MKNIQFSFSIFFMVLIISSEILPQWNPTNGPYGGIINSIGIKGNNIFAGTNMGLYCSINNGESWVNSKSIIKADNYVKNIYKLEVKDSVVYASTNVGLFASSDSGSTWMRIPLYQPIQLFELSGNLIVYADPGSISIETLTFSDSKWTSHYISSVYFTNNGLSVVDNIQCLTIEQNYIFVGTNFGIYLSSDSGKVWTKSDSGMTRENVKAIAAIGNNVFVGTDSAGVFLSKNNGASWTPVNSGLNNLEINTLAGNGRNLYAGTNGGGIYVSTDNGNNWSQMNSGLTNKVVNSIGFEGKEIFAGTNGSGIFLYNGSWTSINDGLSATEITSFISNGDNLFVGTKGGGVFLSMDEGDNWTIENSGLTNLNVQALTMKGNYLFAGTSGGGIFRSTDNGANWEAVNSGVNEKNIRCLASNHSFIFAGTDYPPNAPQILTPQSMEIWADSVCIYRSSDNGNSWTIVDSGAIYFSSILTVDSNIFAVRFFGYLLYSSDNGTSWAISDSGLSVITNPFQQQPTPIAPFLVASCGSNLFAGTKNGMYISNNMGVSWSHIKSNLNSVSSFAVKQNNIFAYSINDINTDNVYPDGVYLSTDNGTSWTSVYDSSSGNTMGGPFAPLINTMIVNDNYLFVGTDGNGVWKFPLSKILSVQKQVNEKPVNYNLFQNYPNPFNPTTTIEYSVPKTTFVKINVYDILGKEIEELVNEEKRQGSYSIRFNANKLSSGIYFYRMQAGNYVETRKLILLK